MNLPGCRVPGRMANQLALLLVLALLVSNVIAMLVVQRTGALIHPLSRTLALERLITAYQAGHGLAAAESERLLAAMSTSDARFWIESGADVVPFEMRAEERRLARELIARLGLAPDTHVAVQLERANGALARVNPFSAASWQPLRLRTSLDLPDGRHLNALQYPAQAYEWSRLLAYTLPVTSLPLLLIVVVFVRRVVAPVKALAQATERVSRGEWIAPLPLSGPREARELTHAFNLMQARIARHVEGRTRMLAALSHDLNTPITELRLQVELLEDGPLREDMLESLGELRAMVDETLDFVRGDAVQEATCTVSLSGLLDGLARRYRTLGQPLTWAGAEPLECRCRPLALKRALTNLIDNALRHAGDATLTLRREGSGGLRLEILDHGPGIDPAWLSQVFEPFVQVPGGERHGGVGLGLAIARACIQAHGGELTLENRLPTGLCAVVQLPQATPVQRPQKSSEAPSQKVRP